MKTCHLGHCEAQNVINANGNHAEHESAFSVAPFIFPLLFSFLFTSSWIGSVYTVGYFGFFRFQRLHKINLDF